MKVYKHNNKLDPDEQKRLLRNKVKIGDVFIDESGIIKIRLKGGWEVISKLRMAHYEGYFGKAENVSLV